jgi:hypothetical protein
MNCAAGIALEIQQDAALVAMKVLKVRTVPQTRQFGALIGHINHDFVGAPVGELAGGAGTGARASDPITRKCASGSRSPMGVLRSDVVPLPGPTGQCGHGATGRHLRG